MDPTATGLVAGVLGTLVMDSLNRLFAGIGLISRIDVGMIGRMSAGYARGRLRYRSPAEMTQVANEVLLGHIAHYAIGVGLALVYVLGWDVLIGGPASPIWALIYGVATTGVSYFVVFPCMGLGVLGKRSPEGIRAPASSLANHLFYGVGMAIGIALA